MPERQATYRDLVAAEARQLKIPAPLVFALLDQESGGQADATSPVGARGFFQLMPETAKGLSVDPTDPIQNIRGGLTYLRQQLDATKGDVAGALARYHGGPDLSIHGPKTAAYVQSILARLEGGPPQQTAQTGAQAQTQVGTPPPVPEGIFMPGREDRPRGETTFRTQRGTQLAARPGEFEWGAGRTAIGEMAIAFDPRTREGRRNLAAGAGAAAAAVLTRGLSTAPGILAAGARTTIGATGAAAGGAAAEYGEQTLGSAPPDPAAIRNAAVEQGAMEVGGRAVFGVARGVVNRLAAAPVAKSAAAYLGKVRADLMADLGTRLDASQPLARQISTRTGAERRAAGRAAGDLALTTQQTAAGQLKAARRTGAGEIRTARAAGRQGVSQAATAARTGVESAQAQATDGLTQAQRPYEDLLAQPPSVAAAGQRALAVTQGPAKTTLDLMGQAVETAAERGPAISLARAKAKAQDLFDRQIKDLATFFQRGDPDQNTALAQAQQLLESAASSEHREQIMQSLLAAGVPLGIAEATIETARHPAMGTIRALLQAPDEVPFRAAHQLKRAFDENVNWESPAKKSVQQMTKALRIAMREDMRGFAPYDQATAAYEAAAPLFSKGFGQQIRRQALVEPSAFIHRITPKQPQQVRMLRELLVGLPDQVGSGEEGLAAWNAVRLAWGHEKLVKGGVQGLRERITALDPDFRRELFGDTAGQGYLDRLQTIASAAESAISRGAVLVEAAKTTGKAGVTAAREAGQHGVDVARQTALDRIRAMEQSALRTSNAMRAQGQQLVESTTVVTQAERDQLAGVRQALRREKQLAQQTTDEEVRFKGSSIFPNRLGDEKMEAIADWIRLVALGPGTFWGAYSLGRLLLHGPTTRDLLTWSAYSPAHTRALVQFISSPANDAATADLLRLLASPLTPDDPGRYTAAWQAGPIEQVATPPPGR